MSRAARWSLAAAVAAALLVAGGVLAFRAALEVVRARLVAALGAGSEVVSLRVGLTAIDLEGLRIPGGEGWPANDALRVERVVIRPSLRTLLSERIEIAFVTMTRPYVSALRTGDGRLRALPSLLEPAPSGGGAATAEAPPGPAPPGRSVRLVRLDVEDGAAELFDASVASPPWKLRFEGVRARVSNGVGPGLDSRMDFTLSATLVGVEHPGALESAGWRDGRTGDFEARTTLHSADLLALEPYLLDAGDARLRHGTLDMELDSKLQGRRLHAPGRIVLSGLEFAPRGLVDTVMGLPRDAVMTGLEGREGRIELSFTIEGDVDDPRFSLNEEFATRVAVGLAEGLGVSVQGLAEGVEGLGRRGIEKAGEAARGAGSAVRRGLEGITP